MKVLRLVSLGVGLVALVLLVRMGVFMIDASRTDFSIEPGDPWRREHSCLTAYAEAARFAADGDRNIYDRHLYAEPTRHIGGLKVDPYHYPPPFLILPGAIQRVTGGYLALRPVWFALQVGLLVAMMLAIARWLGGREGRGVLLAMPLFFVAPITLFSLQMGNFQSSAFALSLLGMIALHAQRTRMQIAGGAALAFATLGKVFPGILGVVLLAGRRWRAVVWTVAAAALFVALALAIYGTRPFEDFIGYELPQLSSGEAFPQSERANTLAVNQSFYGVLVKLRALGVGALDQRTGLRLTSLYGLVVLAIAGALAWRRRAILEADRTTTLLVWLALLNLASFRSPFVGGGYGVMGTVLLVTLAFATTDTLRARIAWGAAYVALATIALAVPTPMPPTWPTPPATWVVVVALAGQLLAIALNVVPLVRAWTGKKLTA